MSDQPVSGSNELSPIKRALLEIRELRERVAAYETAASEPIAVVGLGCRLPGGVVDEESLWRVLCDGIDTVREVPRDRWDIDAVFDPDPDRPGTMWTRYGAFLDQVDGFDAAFFGIAPREAASMDPQQRLFLEVAWEALENAAIATDTLAGSATGVFVGVGNNDYFRLLLGSRPHIDAYAGSGGSASVIAGRFSYLLGLQGPSIAVDTACSASLVAVHLACQSLRRGECDLAVAGGVNLILSPEAHITFTKARMMSRDGRCKAFDAAADGYGRGEGCAVVALRRLSVAEQRGDRVLALIRGSAINQDGRSGGLTAPNGPAQEAVIRAALKSARLRPRDLDYVEAHGTGTSLGDPIEVQALGVALGDERPADRPLLIGSCKSNFGHLEAAAGIAGLVKLVAALRRRQIPPHLHFKTPNPLIDWRALPLSVASRLQAWPANGAPARCGVSSFGFSGTNAHVILEEAPLEAARPVAASTVERPLHVLTLSARDEAALRELGARYQTALGQGAAASDICFSANAGRAHWSHRTSVRGASTQELGSGLAAYLAGATHPCVVTGSIGLERPRVAFLFTGQGAQYPNMGRDLYETSPVFRGAIDACARVLDGVLPQPLRDVLYGASANAQQLDQTRFAQPALFAVEYALALLWRWWGVEPALLIGHSLGEYVAATVAGVIPLGAALRVVAERGRITQSLPGEGAMVAVFAAEHVVAEQLASAEGALAIAAYNGPEHFVVSGTREAVERMVQRLECQGVRSKALRVSHGFHSFLVEPAMAEFGAAFAGVEFAPVRNALVSNLTGRIAGEHELGQTTYWLEHMRKPVLFEQSVRTAAAQGISHFLEIGPHPVLLGMAAECIASTSAEWLPSLRRGKDSWPELLDSLQRLYVAGVPIRWDRFDSDYARRRVALPSYPFRHRRHWVDWVLPTAAAIGTDSQHVWRSATEALARQADQGPLGVELTGYAEKWDCLERLTVAYAASVLRTAGIFTTPGDRATPAEVRQRLGAPETYRHLLERWIVRLAKADQLRADGDAFVCDRALAEPDLAACIADAERLLADNQPLLAYVLHCGKLLHAVLTGKESALETLFPAGSYELAEGIYQRSSTMRYINGLAASAVQALVAARGGQTALRVLEIGAGTGGTSAALIPLLPAQRTRYWFTDVTPLFLDRAREKFSSFAFMRFGELDLERDPASQGFAAASFDLIVAANAVHATRDLRRSLERLRALLAPGGTLLLVESTSHLAWFDMTTGLIEGWQHFADDLRTDNPLLAPDVWLRALREAGFDEAGAWPSAGSPAEAMGQHVVMACVAGGAVQLTPASTFLDEPHDASVPANAVKSTRDADALLARLAQALPVERMDLLRDFVRSQVMQVLRLDPAEPPGRSERLMDLGFDSLMAVQLRNLLGTGLGFERALPATLMFDHPTIDALAAYLMNQLASQPSAAVAQPRDHRPGPAALEEAAVAAMSDAQIEALLVDRLESQ